MPVIYDVAKSAFSVFRAFSCVVGFITFYFVAHDLENVPNWLRYVLLAALLSLCIEPVLILFVFSDNESLPLPGKITSALAIVFSFITAPMIVSMIRDQKNTNRKREQQALEIAKHFGDCRLALFRFAGKEDAADTCVWALIEFNPYRDKDYEIWKNKNCYVVETWDKNAWSTKAEIEAKVNRLIALLPYEIDTRDAYISFAEYEERAHAL